MSKRLVIIDGHNTAFRSAAVIRLNSSRGEPTGTVFGVLQSVRHTLTKFKPDWICVCWDGGRDKSRVDLLPEYKRTVFRKKHKDTWDREQVYRMIDVSIEMLNYLGIPQYRFSKREADDIIAWLARVRSFDEVIIVSTDKDFYQLIDKRISIYNPITDKMLTCDNFPEVSKTGLTPKQYLEFHILNGDKGDNIPGVPGIGEKTALSLISRFSDIENLLLMMKIDSNPLGDEFSSRELKVLDHVSRLYENKKLITLNGHLADLRKSANILISDMSGRDIKSFTRLARRYEFHSILSDMNFWLLPFRKLLLKTQPKSLA